MTDNRTTELREKLEERGIEYEADDRKTYAYTYWGDWAYCEPLDAKPGTLGAQCELMLIPATPEQAIAATLGSGEHEGTRWHELFGTPERAARTSWCMLMCNITKRCGECPIADGCDIATDIDCDDGEAALLEWLRREAE